ncbi:hypothetical protein [Halobacillus salinus]|uniref:Uncharacterized protein n=1 Tax=Halobacillus salinus TaxID=192814 RepID=A0A4Z0GZM9_9BACI|nr:hypothetical protein [Halobacillus salinus]TGB03682.1 hypothetical protein E4663_01370 [Halobacillus salinus]
MIAPAITLLPNEPPPNITVGQYIMAGGGALGLVAMAISKAWEKKRNESEGCLTWMLRKKGGI